MFFTEAQEKVLYKLHGHEEGYTENIDFLKNSLDPFITKEVAPNAAKNDAEEIFPVETFHKLGELGFMSIPFPEEYDGLGLPFTYYCSAIESLSKADAGFAMGVAIHGTATDGIAHYAHQTIKDKYLADLIAGRKIAAFALSEVTSGSDAQTMNTTFRYDEATHEYVLNGTKYWITNGMSADIFFVMARGENDKKVSAFVVDKEGKGTFEQHKIHDKMGVRSSNTAELVFQEYRIPEESLVGEIGRGFKFAMRMLNGGRITIGAMCIGIAQGAFEKLQKYAYERELFGKRLCDLDNTKKEFSEMIIEIAASRELYHNAAYYKEDPNVALYAAISKVKGTEASVKVCDRVIQLSGGYGYVKESNLERPLRDALLGRIGEGANEVLKIVVIPRILDQAFEKKPLTFTW